MIDAPVYVYTAFLDVLAYRHFLEQDRTSGHLDFQQRLSSALSSFDGCNETIFRVQSISDSIIISCADHNNFLHFLEMLRDVFIKFMSEDLFVRGGIAYALHFQNNHLTYSHSVAIAYELESQQAIYPRIVLDKNIIMMYHIADNLQDILHSELICEENGIYFLNIIKQDNWKTIYDFAKHIYQLYLASETKTEDSFEKHLRFQRYIFSSRYAPFNATQYIMPINFY